MWVRVGEILMMAGCVTMLAIVAARMGAEWLLNLCMRGVLGVVILYFAGALLKSVGISLEIGVNYVTLLTSAILGFPGVFALLGIGFYRLL